MVSRRELSQKLGVLDLRWEGCVADGRGVLKVRGVSTSDGGGVSTDGGFCLKERGVSNRDGRGVSGWGGVSEGCLKISVLDGWGVSKLKIPSREPDGGGVSKILRSTHPSHPDGGGVSKSRGVSCQMGGVCPKTQRVYTSGPTF